MSACEQLAWVEHIAWFTVKVYFFLFLFIWIRATLPRLRYDQLMRFGWKVMLPIALANIIITAITVYFFPEGLKRAMSCQWLILDEANYEIDTINQSNMTFKAWIKTITFYEILVGMKATMSHMLHYRPITLQYPHEKRTLPDNYRGMLALLRYDDGTEKCVGCDLCEAACPSRVIRVVSAEVPGEPTKRYSKEYYMDMTRCLFCGLCVDACPVDALGMTREFEWSVYDKRQLHLNKEQLLAIGDRSFPVREKQLELQHPNVAFFNVAFKHLPQKPG